MSWRFTYTAISNSRCHFTNFKNNKPLAVCIRKQLINKKSKQSIKNSGSVLISKPANTILLYKSNVQFVPLQQNNDTNSSYFSSKQSKVLITRDLFHHGKVQQLKRKQHTPALLTTKEHLREKIKQKILLFSLQNATIKQEKSIKPESESLDSHKDEDDKALPPNVVASDIEEEGVDTFILVSNKHAKHEAGEVTVYVKGFLSKGESSIKFDHWKACHQQLETTHHWSGPVLGYHWQSGEFFNIGSIPVPLATVANIGYSFYKTARLFMVPSPQKVAIVAAQELALTAAHLYQQYSAATSHIEEHAQHLAEKLTRLRAMNGHVRVVAHSLGCRMLLQCLDKMDFAMRPDEIHLCAPAIVETDVSDKLSNLARKHTIVYYSERDMVLNSLFKMIEFDDAIGSTGLQNNYDNVTCINVDNHFGVWVHREYRNLFHQFAKRC